MMIEAEENKQGMLQRLIQKDFDRDYAFFMLDRYNLNHISRYQVNFI